MATPVNGRVHVFIMEPHVSNGVYSFPWDWGKWKHEPRLIPLTDTPRARSMGEASFRMLRQIRYEPEQPRNFHLGFSEDNVIGGAWICIAVGDMAEIYPAGGLVESAIQWWGWIARIDKTPVLINSFTDAIGTVSALEVGHILDSVQVQGWRQESGDEENYGEVINSPPTANIATKGGVVIGNALELTNLDSNGHHGYGFVRLPDDCGTAATSIFTRWRLLRHFTLCCIPEALPEVSVACADGSEEDDPVDSDPAWDPDLPRIAAYLNDTDGPEIYELHDLTMKGALDLLIPETHDLDYRIDCARDTWTIRIATISTEDAYGLPAATPVDVNLYDIPGDVVDFSPSEQAADVPDEVVFEGAAYRFGVSACHLEGNWTRKYSSTQQENYEDAPPVERRTSPEHEDAFTLFGVDPNATGDLRRYLLPGTAGGASLAMCPEVGWSGTADTAADRKVRIGYRWNEVGSSWSASTVSHPPYLPTATLLRVIPWPVGLKSDGTDSRTDYSKAHPSYLKPKVFNVDLSLEAADQWFELTAKRNPETDASNLIDEIPQVEADDGGANLRIAFSVPHRLGLGTFDEASDDDNVPPELDWRKFLVTFGIQSDQRLRISKRRPGVDSHRVRRSVVVRDERFQFWAVLKGTVLGVKDDSGTAVADRLTVTNEDGELGYITRNDYPAAEKYCRRLATYAFRPRNPVSITLLRPDAPPVWARIGVVIGNIVDTNTAGNDVTFTSNTIIREIRRTWGDSPRIEISTEMLSQPKPVSPSPDAGGAVSVANGGTLAQGVARLRTEVAKLNEDTQRKIIYPGSPPPTVAIGVLSSTLGTDTIVTIGASAYKGILSPGTVPTEVPQADPSALVTFPAYLGKARLDGGDWVWVGIIVKPAGVNIYDLLAALPNNQKFMSRQTVQMPITGGGGATATLYLPWVV